MAVGCTRLYLWTSNIIMVIKVLNLPCILLLPCITIKSYFVVIYHKKSIISNKRY